MQTVIAILGNALFLAVTLLFVSLDRRVGRLEHQRRDAIARRKERDAAVNQELAALRDELAALQPAAAAPRGFDEGLADIFGYGLEQFGAAASAFNTEDTK